MSDYEEPDFDIDDEDLELSDEEVSLSELEVNSEDDASESDSEIEEIIDDCGNSENTIINNNITINRLTKYEYVNILGTRAQQISRGAKIFVSTDNMKIITPIEIAKKEIAEGKLPLKIKRVINGNIEYIRIHKKFIF
jgi:DNA-directed RNA polymerase subunit K/omega